MNKYKSQMFGWAVDRVITAKIAGVDTTEAIIAEAHKLAEASYSVEKDFEGIVAELVELFKTVEDPLAKAQFLQMELGVIIEEIESQAKFRSAAKEITERTSTQGAA